MYMKRVKKSGKWIHRGSGGGGSRFLHVIKLASETFIPMNVCSLIDIVFEFIKYVLFLMNKLMMI